MANRFTSFILVAMLLGIAVGAVGHGALGEAERQALAGNLAVVTDVFLRLIKMIIAPLVFATLVAGVAHMGDGASLGRIGLKTMVWFLGATVCSLGIGILMVSLLQPGVGLGLPLPEAAQGAASGLKVADFTLKGFITHLVPKSVVEAMANNEILQIVIFSLFFGASVSALGERGRPIAALVDDLGAVMLKLTGYVMVLAPFAVFAAVAATVAVQGLAILLTYGKFIGGFYLSLALLWALLLLAGYALAGGRVFRLIQLIREPVLIAFSTASSEAAYPRTLERLERFGIPKRIASFVLPLGYSFNLDGSMMYCTFATVFIAQAYGIDLSWGQKLTMLLLLMVTSKGMAAVPRASLVVISATLGFLGIPEAGLLLILAIDQFLDMGRSATNVVGNSVASLAIARWENSLDREREALSDGETVADAAERPRHENVAS